MTRSEVQLMNETLFENLMNPGMIKTAIDAVNDFTRIKMREDGFARKLMPPLKIANDELDRQVNTDKPAKVVDKEPDSPAAISIPFATLPTNVYIRGPRYLVAFDRIATPRFTKDVDELRTYVMDIRQVLSDNAIKDMLAEEDSKLIGATNLALIGPDTPVPLSGIPPWETVYRGITRDSVMDAPKIMAPTGAHLSAATVLINNVSIMEVMKWGRDDMGGDFSQDVVRNGWSETDFLDKRWVISIKRDLIPDETIFMFADPKFIGKMYILEDTTMYIKRDAYLLEFFACETLGGTIAHSGGLARADFA